MPRMAGDDGRSVYHTCGPMTLPAVIDQYFVKHLHWTPPLILIVYSRLDIGIQSVTEMLPLKRGEGVPHFNCTPHLCIRVLLTHLYHRVHVSESQETSVTTVCMN